MNFDSFNSVFSELNADETVDSRMISMDHECCLHTLGSISMSLPVRFLPASKISMSLKMLVDMSLRDSFWDVELLLADLAKCKQHW